MNKTNYLFEMWAQAFPDALGLIRSVSAKPQAIYEGDQLVFGGFFLDESDLVEMILLVEETRRLQRPAIEGQESQVGVELPLGSLLELGRMRRQA